ncbi:MAG: Fe-S cluster assembly protein SufD [Varibaculum sp.]|nr:Fe-S cluster assembly protein SufD [Varibaculum sp.]
MSAKNPNNVARPIIADRAARPTSFDMAVIPMPSGHEEEWRFTSIRRLDGLLTPASQQLIPDVSKVKGAVTQQVLRSDPRVGRAGAPGDRPAVVSWTAAETVTLVTVGADLEEPLWISSTGGGHQRCNQYLVIEVAPKVRAEVILEHTGDLELNQTVEIVLGDEADLNLVSLQEWDASAKHTANHRASIGREAHLKHLVVTLSGDLVRICSDVAYTGEGAEAHMNGLYFTSAGEHQEHRLFIDHNHPNCVSRVTYKGALQGLDAHSVWVGDVLIGRNAAGTDSYEQNRNLILSQGAHADSVPNLEIQNGNIPGAGHASATGRFDEEQLFYLMSRGITEREARRLVVHAFFAELMAEIGLPAVEERLLDKVDDLLRQGETGE